MGGFYVDSNHHVYGPKRAGGWGEPTGLVRSQGSTGPRDYSVLHGDGAPARTLGAAGDFYIDTLTTQLYGPNEQGVWGSPVSFARAGTSLAAAATTKQVDYPVGGAGISISVSQGWDFVQRVLAALPETPTQFRFRIANYAAVATTGGGSAALACQGVYLGVPSFGAGARWTGQFVSAPQMVVAVGNTVPAGTSGAGDYVTGWIQNNGLITRVRYSASDSDSTAAGRWSTTRSAIRCGGTTMTAEPRSRRRPDRRPRRPVPSPTWATGSWILRLEYEVPASNKVVVCIGDSITYGWSNQRGRFQDSGAAPYEAWPGAAALATQQHLVNLGAPGSTALQWTGTSGWMWKRWAAIAQTVPDVGIISLGSNDLAAGESASAIEGYISTLIGHQYGLGVGEVWLGTVLPRGWVNGNEAARMDVNRWIRSMRRESHACSISTRC